MNEKDTVICLCHIFIFLTGCETNKKPLLKRTSEPKETSSEESTKIDEEPLDYRGSLGMIALEFEYDEGMVLSEDTEMSAILDMTCMTGEREEEYMGLKGTTQARFFGSDQYGVPAEHIFDVLWSVGDTENNVEAVDAKIIENIIAQYDGYYGTYEVSEDVYGDNKVTIY